MEEIDKANNQKESFGKQLLELIGIMIVTFIAHFLKVKLKHDDPPKEVARKLGIGFLEYIAAMIIISVAIVIFVALYIYFHKIFDFIRGQWTPENAIYFATAGVFGSLASGYGLYKFKKKEQAVYGLIEIAASIAYCIYTFINLIEHTPNTLGMTASLISVIYFTQRGFNNFHDGLKPKTNK